MAKKYYWLKLKENFFSQPKIKKLRRIAGGDTYTIIYLKLQLLSLKDEGNLYFEGIEDDFIEELALTIDEEIDNVKFTVMFLINQGLIEEIEKDEFSLTETKIAIGSESESTQRVRKMRERKKAQKALQCNDDVTKCNTEIEKELELEIEIYNSFIEICTSLPKPKKLTDTRKRAIKSRLKEYDKDTILEVFNNVQASDFLSGRKSEWKANFDWIFKPSNFVKIREGNYTNNKSKGQNVNNINIYSNTEKNGDLDDLPF